MVYRTRIDPKGPTRHLGRRGALKQSTFVRLQKSDSLLTVESPFEVFLLKLLDLSVDVVSLEYQPFTIDVTNDRLFKTHEEFKRHRQVLREAGLTGVFYTPDIKVNRTSDSETRCEVIEAKDADWIPTDDDYYGQKLLTTMSLLETRGVSFNLYEASNRRLYRSDLAHNINKLHALNMQREDVLGTLSDSYLEYANAKSRLISALESESLTTIEVLCGICSVTPFAVWQLIIDGCALIDLAASSLGPKTEINFFNISEGPAPIFKTALASLQTSVREASHV